MAAQTASDEKTVVKTNRELAPAGRLQSMRLAKGSRRAPYQRKASRTVLAVAFTRYGGEAVSVARAKLALCCAKPGR